MRFETITAIVLAASMVAAAPIEQNPMLTATKTKRGANTGAELAAQNEATYGLFGNGNSYGNAGIGGTAVATIDSITKLLTSPIRGILNGGGILSLFSNKS